MTYWIPVFGVPQQLHSDQGETDATIIENMCSILGITKTRTPAYTPAAKGANEAFNKTLGTLIKVGLPEYDIKDWHILLPFFVNAYNNLPHTSTQYAPAELTFGKLLSHHVVPLVAPDHPIIEKSDYLKALRKGQEYHWKICHDREVQNKLSRCQNMPKKENRFLVGDYVLIKIKGPRLSKIKGTKHLPNYSGPFKVIATT